MYIYLLWIQSSFLISIFPRFFYSSFETVPSTPNTIGITVTLMLHNRLTVFLFIIIIALLVSFLHQRLLVAFYFCLRDKMSDQVFKTLLGTQADLSDAIVCLISILLLISKFSSLFIQAFGDRSKCTYYNR